MKQSHTRMYQSYIRIKLFEEYPLNSLKISYNCKNCNNYFVIVIIVVFTILELVFSKYFYQLSHKFVINIQNTNTYNYITLNKFI